jgi:hypothetical protein
MLFTLTVKNGMKSAKASARLHAASRRTRRSARRVGFIVGLRGMFG